MVFQDAPKAAAVQQSEVQGLRSISSVQLLSSDSASQADYLTVWEAGSLLLLCPDVGPNTEYGGHVTTLVSDRAGIQSPSNDCRARH